MESCYTTRKMLQQKLGVGDWLHVMMTFPRDRWSCAMLLRSYGRTWHLFFWGRTFESKRTTYRSLWSKDVFRRMKLPKGLPGWVVADFVFTDFSFDVFSVSGGLLFRTDCKGDRKRKYLKLKHGTYKGPTRSGQTSVVALHLPRKIADEPLKQNGSVSTMRPYLWQYVYECLGYYILVGSGPDPVNSGK